MLIHALRRKTADATARSFRLVGEDLVRMTFEDHHAAVDAWSDAFAAVPASMRDLVLEQHEAHAREAHVMLCRYNSDLHSRIRGYLAVARATGFELPWPTVAVLGLSEIARGALAFHAFALLAEGLRRLGVRGPAELAAELDDFTRRTNRGIFADSVPTLLFAIRCRRLRRQGRDDLADAVLLAPPPLVMDEDAWAIVRALDRAFAVDDGQARFEALVKVGLSCCEREQAVFTQHVGTAFRPRGLPSWLRKHLRIRATRAPVVEPTPRGQEVMFRRHELPEGFDFADHDARVSVILPLFCSSITRSVDDFRAAVRFATSRFEPDRPARLPAFDSGGTPVDP